MEHELPAGTLLAGRYRIKKVLGQGGFGITYLATFLADNSQVCVKELYLSGSCTRSSNYSIQSQNLKDIPFQSFKDKFITEARELAKFNHPGIVRVSDVFEQFGTAYYVMDYVEGSNLKQFVEQHGKLSLPMARNIIFQLLEALKEVHKKGLLHRDIKPDNVLLSIDNRVVLIDFGSARTFEQGKTQSHTTILTPGYAPIEQYSDVAKRGQFSDIYSLGATFYFMLTAKKPVSATDRALVEFPKITTLNLEVSNGLNAIIFKCMNMAPEKRYQTIEELLVGLKEESVWSLKEVNESESAPPPLIVDVEKEKEKSSTRFTWFLLIAVIGFLIYVITKPRENTYYTPEEVTATEEAVSSESSDLTEYINDVTTAEATEAVAESDNNSNDYYYGVSETADYYYPENVNFTNNSNNKVYMSFAYKDNDGDWICEGWYQIEGNSTYTFDLPYRYTGNEIYWFGQTENYTEYSSSDKYFTVNEGGTSGFKSINGRMVENGNGSQVRKGFYRLRLTGGTTYQGLD